MFPVAYWAFMSDFYHANANPMARKKSRPLDSICQMLMMKFRKPRAPKSLSLSYVDCIQQCHDTGWNMYLTSFPPGPS
jgi:hypothetical protein